ncbi:reverse transcriptase domain-containing protein [Tanacetum coccineum]
MKFNLKKCSFGMEEGKFLGYIVTSKGIKTNPEKEKAVMDMPSPKTLKQMQSLKAAEAAFLEMKKLVYEFPTLTTPKKGETLMMYLAATNEAVSVVLLAKRDGKQMPIHYVIRSLQGAETNYALMEKLALSLVHAAKRLRRYFQAHPIKVITDSPIRQVLNNSGASRRLGKWVVELGAYGITYVPRVAVKGQNGWKMTEATEAAFLEMKKLVSELPTFTTLKKGETLMMGINKLCSDGETRSGPSPRGQTIKEVLADFLAYTPTEINATPKVANNPRVEDIPESSNAIEDLTPGPRAWRLYTDGASNNEGSRAGLILIAPNDVEYSYALRLNFSNSNNDVEYEALLAGLQIAKEMQVKDIHAFVDSKLVASQVEGSYEAKAENRKADALSKLAAVQFDHLSKEVLVDVLNECSVEAQEKGKLPEDPVDARTLMENIGNYTMEDGVLYRKSYLVPLMRCVGPLQANYIIKEVHMGSCEMHDGPRQVVAKAMNLGYYWPSMHRDVRELIRACDDFQAHVHMAIYEVGYGHSGTSPREPGKGGVPNRGNRLLYQMDGGEAASYHYCDKGLPTFGIRAHYESEKEAIHLILTGIGDEIYSTVDACQKATTRNNLTVATMQRQCSMSSATFNQNGQRFEVNELRAERMAKNANPLALVATAQTLQDPYKGKGDTNKYTTNSECQLLKEDSDLNMLKRSKEMQKNLALIAKTRDEEIDEQELKATFQLHGKDSGVEKGDSNTQNDSFAFVHELKQEMHADLKYVESLEDELDELESDKAEFSNMYDMLLQECVAKMLLFYLQSFI